jgi:hypothetical protein
MFIKILIGSGMIMLNLGIQVLAIALLMSFLQRRIRSGGITLGATGSARVLALIMLFLLFAHLLQFATWGALFVGIGEFQDFETAFYHSTVNFTSLGYGDIVMSEEWRLLGALEAANGVLMFGLSAGLILSSMNALFKRRGGRKPHKQDEANQDGG